MNAADQKADGKTRRQSQPESPQDQGLPHGPHILPREHPVTHPTLKIIGLMLVKQAFLIVALFRRGAARGRNKRDPTAPKAPPREPQGAPRLPKVHQCRAFGCLLCGLFVPNVYFYAMPAPRRPRRILETLCYAISCSICYIPKPPRRNDFKTFPFMIFYLYLLCFFAFTFSDSSPFPFMLQPFPNTATPLELLPHERTRAG